MLDHNQTDDVRALTAAEFERIRRLAYDKFGLDLRHGKEQLVSARLGKMIRAQNCHSFDEYYQRVIQDRSGDKLVELIDALATNHTSFLREPQHFDFLREQILPGLRGRGRVDIWCAASSTGEEPYTIAFSILDAWGMDAARRVRILATDISTKALAKAENAVYSAQRFQDVPANWQRRFLLRGTGRWKGSYRVRPEVREMVDYRRLNLIEPYHHRQPFSLIFCRNVMIYFDKPTQAKVVRQMAQFLEPGGYLLIGHAESLHGLDQPLTYMRPAVYYKGPTT